MDDIIDIRFRAWCKIEKVMCDVGEIKLFSSVSQPYIIFDDYGGLIKKPVLMQYVGIKDNVNRPMYHKDICEFEDGDRFIIETEDHIEFFVSWIGDPYCEDQARDFYRISNAKVIGNSFENPELLNKE